MISMKPLTTLIHNIITILPKRPDKHEEEKVRPALFEALDKFIPSSMVGFETQKDDRGIWVRVVRADEKYDIAMFGLNNNPGSKMIIFLTNKGDLQFGIRYDSKYSSPQRVDLDNDEARTYLAPVLESVLVSIRTNNIEQFLDHQGHVSATKRKPLIIE